jgi:hypothetical protein
MPRPDKINSLDDLKNHINAWAIKRGLHSRFGTFEDMYKKETSVSSRAETFDCNYRTMVGWIAKYEIFKGERREQSNRKAA